MSTTTTEKWVVGDRVQVRDDDRNRNTDSITIGARGTVTNTHVSTVISDPLIDITWDRGDGTAVSGWHSSRFQEVPGHMEDVYVSMATAQPGDRQTISHSKIVTVREQDGRYQWVYDTGAESMWLPPGQETIHMLRWVEDAPRTLPPTPDPDVIAVGDRVRVKDEVTNQNTALTIGREGVVILRPGRTIRVRWDDGGDDCRAWYVTRFEKVHATVPNGSAPEPEPQPEPEPVVEDEQVTRLRAEVEALRRVIADGEEWKEALVRNAHQMADDKDYCHEFDDFMEENGLPRRSCEWDVTVEVTFTTTVRVEAESEHDALTKADVLRSTNEWEHAIADGVLEYNSTNVGNWSASEAEQA